MTLTNYTPYPLKSKELPKRSCFVIHQQNLKKYPLHYCYAYDNLVIERKNARRQYLS